MATIDRQTRRLIPGILALSLVAAACGTDTPSASTSPDGDNTETVTIDDLDIQLTSGLATFGSCDSLLTHLQTEGAERVGAFGFNGNGGFFFGDGVAVEDEDCLLYTSPSPRDRQKSRMPSSA